MSKFALIKIDVVKGERKFFKLVKDGKCEFDDFIKESEINNPKYVNKVFYRMDLLSRGEILPETQMRIIKGNLKDITEFEIKADDLRVYCFIEKKTVSIAVIGGYKKNQKKDLNRFEGIIKMYNEFKEIKK